MAFTERVTVTSTPGEYQVLLGSTAVAQNFILQNLSIGSEEVELAGYLVWRLYAPTPVDRLATVLSLPCHFESNLFVQPLPALAGLNAEIGFYSTKFKTVQTLRLWTE